MHAVVLDDVGVGVGVTVVVGVGVAVAVPPETTATVSDASLPLPPQPATSAAVPAPTNHLSARRRSARRFIRTKSSARLWPVVRFVDHVLLGHTSLLVLRWALSRRYHAPVFRDRRELLLYVSAGQQHANPRTVCARLEGHLPPVPRRDGANDSETKAGAPCLAIA